MRRFFVLLNLIAFGLLFFGASFPVQAAALRQGFDELSPAAQGAEPPRLAEAHLALWPEYDDPTLLVIVAGQLPQGTPMPATLRMLIPAGAVLNAAAYEGEGGTLVHASQSRKTSATQEWDEVSFEVESTLFQFEYYHNAIKGGPDKSISFDYRFFYPVDELTLEAQQPLRATNFVTKPETKNILTGERGFRYYRFSFSKVEAGKALPLEISYTKADNEPSVQPQPQELSPPATPVETGPNWTTIGLLGGGVAVFAAFLWVVVRRRAREAAPAPVRRGASFSTTPTAAQRRRGATGAARPNFCPNCGEPLGANVNFCPNCGESI